MNRQTLEVQLEPGNKVHAAMLNTRDATLGDQPTQVEGNAKAATWTAK